MMTMIHYIVTMMVIDGGDDGGDVKIEERKKHTGNSSALVLSICTERSKANLNRHIFVLKNLFFTLQYF